MSTEIACARCHRVCFSQEELDMHSCFDIDARLDAEIARAQQKDGHNMEVLPPGAQRIDLEVSSPPDHSLVRVQFDRQLSYLILPKEHAIRFAIMILEHAGAELENLPAKPPAPPLEE